MSKTSFVIENDVLIKYEGSSSAVVIPDGIIAVGKEAFAENAKVVSVTCPASVRHIEVDAFYKCPKLTTVELVGVEIIESGAFYNCNKLSKLSLPSTLREIGNNAFLGCGALSDVLLPDGLEKIGSGAFAQCNLARVVVPKTVQVLEHEAFSCCPDIVVYDTVDPAAEDCSAKIDMLNGYPNSQVGFVGIGPARARWDCVLNHRWVDHVITVCSAQTDQTKYKVFMVADPGQRNYQCLLCSAWGANATFHFTALDEFFQKIKKGKLQVALSRLTYKVDLSPEVEERYRKYIARISKEAVSFCIDNNDMDGLKLCADCGAVKASNRDDLLEYATQKGNAEAAAFIMGCCNKTPKTKKSAPKESTLSEKLPAPKKPKVKAKIWDVEKQNEEFGFISRYNGDETEIEFPTEVDGLTICGIASRSGSTPENYKKLTSVVIPEGYTWIGNKAFEGCVNLRQITLAATVTEIGNEAFARCCALESVVLPPRMKYIDAYVVGGGKGMFRDCTALKDVFVTNRKMYISDSTAFKGCKGYSIHAAEKAAVFDYKNCKKFQLLTEEDLQKIAAIYYGVPRVRTVHCTQCKENLPQVGDILYLKCRYVKRDMNGWKLTEEEVHVGNDRGLFYGYPTMAWYEYYRMGISSQDMALHLVAPYVVARVISEAKTCENDLCFDVEIMVAE